MIFAGTGHRPPKIGGYDKFPVVVNFAVMVLTKLRPDEVISGMALGWDMALAQAAIQLSIPFTAALPFIGQGLRWPEHSQVQYERILGHAKDTIVCSQGGYSPDKMQVRNEWMVDHSSHVLALWNGSSGGTFNCIKYANSVDKMVMNVWKPWEEFLAFPI